MYTMTISEKLRASEETFSDITKSTLNQSYVAITNDVQITVWPEFLDSRFTLIGDLFMWAYHVRIDNRGVEPVQLLSRYWRIVDAKGAVQEINGEGVIGEQPTIEPGKYFQYTSGTHLYLPSGIMVGHYKMQKISPEKEDKIFDAKIPSFSLDIPAMKISAHIH